MNAPIEIIFIPEAAPSSFGNDIARHVVHRIESVNGRATVFPFSLAVNALKVAGYFSESPFTESVSVVLQPYDLY